MDTIEVDENGQAFTQQHSDEFFEERQKMLERNAAEIQAATEVRQVAIPVPQHQFTSREEVLDFIRKSVSN